MSFDQLPAAVERLQTTVNELIAMVVLLAKDKEPEVMNIEEAAKHIDRSVAATRMLLYRKAIKGHKRKGRVYFKREELNEWMVSEDSTVEVDTSQYMKKGRSTPKKLKA